MGRGGGGIKGKAGGGGGHICSLKYFCVIYHISPPLPGKWYFSAMVLTFLGIFPQTPPHNSPQ